MKSKPLGEMYVCDDGDTMAEAIESAIKHFQGKHGYAPDYAEVRHDIPKEEFPLPLDVLTRSNIPPRHFILVPVISIEREPVISPERTPVL